MSLEIIVFRLSGCFYFGANEATIFSKRGSPRSGIPLGKQFQPAVVIGTIRVQRLANSSS